MSPEAVELLQAIEVLRLKPYDDDHPKKDLTAWVDGATIGYGHLILKDEWDRFKNGISEEKATELFRRDAEPKEAAVAGAIKVGVQQYEFDAMVILTFNIGESGFRKSTVAKLINDPKPAAGHLKLLETAWKSWNKETKGGVKVVSKGLTNRRAAEWRIYTSAVYQRW